MAMCDLDESGRPAPKEVEGSSFVIDADTVIQAIGTSPNPLLVRLLRGAATGRKGNLVVDEDGRTSVPRVYAGGDIATGAATVILAMGAGKRAAAAIDADLRGRRTRPDFRRPAPPIFSKNSPFRPVGRSPIFDRFNPA